jgi:NADH:ubiquinone oxidoreductase subunit 4 (subunit M)
MCGIFAQNSLSLILSLIGVILRAVCSLWAYARVVYGMPKRVYIHGMAQHLAFHNGQLHSTDDQPYSWG